MATRVTSTGTWVRLHKLVEVRPAETRFALKEDVKRWGREQNRPPLERKLKGTPPTYRTTAVAGVVEKLTGLMRGREVWEPRRMSGTTIVIELVVEEVEDDAAN